MIMMKSRRKKSIAKKGRAPPTEIDVDAFLLNSLMNAAADYIRRGREYKSIENGALLEAWTVAIREMARTPEDAEKRLLYDDLLAEIDFRGLSAPFDQVETAMEELKSKVSITYQKLRQNPKALQELEQELRNDIDEFRQQRDSSKN